MLSVQPHQPCQDWCLSFMLPMRSFSLASLKERIARADLNRKRPSTTHYWRRHWRTSICYEPSRSCRSQKTSWIKQELLSEQRMNSCGSDRDLPRTTTELVPSWLFARTKSLELRSILWSAQPSLLSKFDGTRRSNSFRPNLSWFQ